MRPKTLIVILGPTGVGKTDLSLALSEQYNIPIISADSRQMYRGMTIGTDAPRKDVLDRYPHYFIGNLDVTDYYSASRYEEDVLKLLSDLYKSSDIALMVGGSMMYLDAVIRGIDTIPDVNHQIRTELWKRYEKFGVVPLRQELNEVDPIYLARIDSNNHKRIIHALEVYYTTGQPFSSFHTSTPKVRPFYPLIIGLNRDRKELYDRINQRVEKMMSDGLVEEVRGLLKYRNLNALNTVGYKETFRYHDGDITLDECIRKIAKNSRIYARKQLSWFRRRDDIQWFDPRDQLAIINHIKSRLTIE